MILSEPDVALTDFGLALECAVFAVWLHRRGPADAFLRRWFVVFFTALGLAALLGGITHGLPPDPQSRLYWLVWTAILLAIGVMAFSGWALGARLVLSETAATHVITAAGAAFVGYASIVLFVSHSFTIAVVHYLPAAVFLLGAFVLLYVRQRNGFLLAGIAGLVLSFVAAAVQQSETSLHPVYFNHNALFHLIQAFALLLIFLAARGFHGPIAR